MKHSTFQQRITGSTRVFFGAATAALLTACGGGGGGSQPPPANAPTVSSAVAGSAKYSQTLTLTISGANLDQGLRVASPACKGMTLSTSAPFVSSTSTAYYQCTVSAVGAGQIEVARSSDAAVLASVGFTVAAPQVTLSVSNGAGVAGSIVITLAPDKTPATVDNFLAYVNARFYDNTVFHRVSPGFVVQGGGYATPLVDNSATPKSTSAPIALEVGKGLSNTQWTIAMARTSDADSATSQFFINLADNSGTLDPGPVFGAGYAVFGTVSAGTDMVAAIAGAPCTAIALFLPAGDCTPLPNVVVTSALQTQ